MIQKQHLSLLVVTLLVALAGCSSGSLVETTDDSGGNGSGDADWCDEGDSTQWTNPETGERVTLNIEGTTTYEGREVCVGSWETNDPDSDAARIEYWYSEDGSYTRIVTYDAQGNIINEFESTGQQSPVTDGMDGNTGQSTWCPTGESLTSSSPQTGEEVSFVYQGIVTEDGNTVCKAVYEAQNTDSDVVRTEYYFNEEGTYTKWVSYDAQGNVVDEQVIDQTDGS